MTERERLEQAIAALEAQRATLGDAVVDTMVAAAREKLAALDARSVADQRKRVTVLFADVSGFTAMSETLDPEEVHDTMNALWARLDAAITAHGGTIDKHIGDAVMALFGAPTAREDDPERAIRAALAMQSEVESWKLEVGSWKPEKLLPSNLQPLISNLQMRIGINTGPVLLGTVGTTGEYTAMGDTVNLASRLEHAAPMGGILISHDTYRHVRGVFDVQPLAPITVKGKAEPIQVYVVERAKPRAFRVTTRGVEGVETRMVGREAELRRLQEALSAVMEAGEARVVTVVGEAGVGKSRLLYEFNNWLELLPESVWLFKGRADEQMSRLPYALIRDLFALRFEIRDSDRAAVARDKLVQGVTSFMGAGSEEKAHFIGHLIGFDFSASPHLHGILDEARQIRSRAFHYTTQFFAAVTEGDPAAIFLEDVHWADEGSLDLIDHLARSCGHLPLLMVCLTRSSLFERRPSWGEKWAAHTRLELHPLSDDDSHQLVAEILRKVPAIPPALRELIVSRAEGNPFYVEELIKVLIEDGVIVKGTEQWWVRPERLAEVRVPPTLTEVLQARLDGLPPPERATLQPASVVGRVFWDGAVERLRAGSDEAEGDTGQALAGLRRKELVFARKTSAFAGTREHIFKHAILRDVTYESVLKRLRRVYHRLAAAWLIEQSGERVGEYAGLIGEHCERAGERRQAVEWYGRAGKQAHDTYAPAAAIGYYRKALALLPEDAEHAGQRVVLYEGLGEMLRWQARYAEAAEAYTAMRAAAEAAGDAVAQARAWNGLSWVQDLQGEYRAALESTGRAEDIARAAGAPGRVELAMALHNKSWGSYRLGDAETALALGEQALALSTELDARREKALSLTLLGTVHWTLGRHEQADGYYGAALGLYRELGNRRGVGAMLNNLGETARIRGDHRAAVALYREALTIAREIGDRDGEMIRLSNLGGAQVGLGEYGAAEEDLRQVIRVAQTAGWGGLSETYCFLAEACLGQGRVEDALAAARRALDLGREQEELADVGAAWRVLGMVAARLPEPVPIGDDAYDAAACFAESLRVFTEMAAEGERARTLWAWARYEMERGDRARGEKMWQQARELFIRLGFELEVERMTDL